MKNSRLNLVLIVLISIFLITCSKDEKVAPAVSIGVLQNNMEVLKGIQMNFPVHVNDEDGQVTSVTVYIDDVELETLTAAPYFYSWTTQDETIGNHNMKAIATDNDGLSTEYAITVNIITATEPVIACPEAVMISYQGQTYTTVKIGDQCWLKSNLNVTTTNSSFYDDDPINGDTYGQLYTWEDAVIACPPGWHVPSYEDWCTLVSHTDASAICQTVSEIGTDAGFKLKSTSGWDDLINGSDQFGFNALPAGVKESSGTYSKMGGTAAFWSSTEMNASSASYFYMNTETTRITTELVPKTESFYVRCLKD